MRKQAIYNHCVYSNYESGSSDDIDAEPEDRHALFDGIRVVEGVVLEGELLVERWDLVDDGEDSDQYTAGGVRQLQSSWAGGRAPCKLG